MTTLPLGQDGPELSVPDPGVKQVHAGRVDLHQQVILPYFRLRDFSKRRGAFFLYRSAMKAFIS
jgi:hypothetical protein